MFQETLYEVDSSEKRVNEMDSCESLSKSL